MGHIRLRHHRVCHLALSGKVSPNGRPRGALESQQTAPSREGNCLRQETAQLHNGGGGGGVWLPLPGLAAPHPSTPISAHGARCLLPAGFPIPVDPCLVDILLVDRSREYCAVVVAMP